MKFLIAGLGSIGRRHLNNLQALGEEDIVLYRTHQSSLPDEGLEKFPVETDLGKALAGRPDAVIISNPTAMHMQVAIPAASAGCALFVEKPLAERMDSLLPLAALLKENGNIFFSAFQFRFNPGLRKVKELLEMNAAGRPISFNAYWGEYLPDWHPWEDYRRSYAAQKGMGGGVVLTLCHPLDYLRWMFGDPVEVFASAGNASDLELDVEDFADALISFNSGISGSLHLDYYRRDKRQDLEVVCSGGTIHWDYAASAVKMRLADGTLEEFPAPDGYERNTMFVEEIAHFLQVLQRNEVSLCTFEDGFKALELAVSILQSARYQRRVIIG